MLKEVLIVAQSNGLLIVKESYKKHRISSPNTSFLVLVFKPLSKGLGNFAMANLFQTLMANNFKGSDSGEYRINDKWLFLFVYPIFAFLAVHLGNDNGFLKLLGIPSYYTDILFALICVYGCGLFIKKVAFAISKRIGWSQNRIKALKFQFVFGLLIPTCIVVLAEIIYLQMIGIELWESSIFYLEFPLAILLLLLINGVYIFMYFQTFYIIALNQKQRLEKKHLVVREGKSAFTVPINEIAYFVKRGNLIFLVTRKGRDYIYDYPFKSIIKKLPQDVFFQLNRQIISSRSSIVKSTKTETRRLKVELSPAMDNEVYVAKANATKFLKWLDNS